MTTPTPTTVPAPAPAASPAKETYNGSCHCGAITFTVRMAKLGPDAKATHCNCAICLKKGALWVYPGQENVQVTKGEGDWKVYTRGRLEHSFCGTCGSCLFTVLADGKPFMGVNVRTFKDVPRYSVAEKAYDGASKPPPYENPEFPSTDLKADEAAGEKIYTGACHCGNVRVAVSSKPLAEVVVKACSCSICSVNNTTLIYPNRSHVRISHPENTTAYLFNRRYNHHRFCSNCGVFCYIDIVGPPTETLETFPAATQKLIRGMMDLTVVNLNILEGVDWEGLKIEKVDG